MLIFGTVGRSVDDTGMSSGVERAVASRAYVDPSVICIDKVTQKAVRSIGPDPFEHQYAGAMISMLTRTGEHD